MPDYSLETAHGGFVVGVDEVGRGPLAGPVLAASVTFLVPPSEKLSELLDDSKKLSLKKRERAFEHLLVDKTVRFGVGAASREEIDFLNIGQACHLAMRRAVKHLSLKMGRMPDLALVDGKHQPNLGCSIKMVIGGDGKSLSIAASSIIAKVLRDRLMHKLSERYPHYGWEKNAGYGTKIHKEGLMVQGVTPHHRRSFAPIKYMTKEECHRA